MSSPRHDLTPIVRSWIRTEETADAGPILSRVLAAVGSTPQRHSRWFGSPFATLGGPLPVAVVAVLVVTITAITVGGLSPGPFGDPTPPVASSLPSSEAQPSTLVPDSFVGLPAVGATPSDPTPGELVLRFEPSTPWMTSWLFADGRLITWRSGVRPDSGADNYIGLVEQRLTPEGVEFLTSQVIATGLFDSDLSLLREGSGFLQIDVRNNGQLVHFGWGHRTWGGDWLTAPSATADQARALADVTDLLSTQASWPASLWVAPSKSAFVPAAYGICVRGVPESVDPDQIWRLLPAAAQDLRPESQAPEQSIGGSPKSCSRLTTDDAWALARILTAAGMHRAGTIGGEIWLRFVFDDPNRSGNTLWISFGPVLPHGEAVWLGPG